MILSGNDPATTFLLDVPTHVWDEKPSISASWDGSTKSDTLDALMKGGAEGAILHSLIYLNVFSS